MMELGHAIKLKLLPVCPLCLDPFFQLLKKKKAARVCLLPKYTQRFTHANKRRRPRAVIWGGSLNVCVYTFQTNLNAPQAVNSEMLPKCHVGVGGFVLENCQTNAVQNQGFEFRLPHTETRLFVFLITSILVSLVWPCFSQVWIYIFLFSMICSQKMDLKLRCPAFLDNGSRENNEQTWPCSSPRLHGDMWQLSVCCFGFTNFCKKFLCFALV